MNEIEESPPAEVLIAPPPEQSILERYGISPVLFVFLALILIFITYQLIGGIVSYALFGLAPTENNVTGLRLITGLGQIFLILAPALALVAIATTRPKQFLHLRLPGFQAMILPIVGIFSLQQMLQIYIVFQDKIPLPEAVETLSRQFKELLEEITRLITSSNSIPELLVVIVVVALIPAFAEEFLFRGLVQRSLEKVSTPIRSVIVTGIIFGAYHLNPFSFIPLAILGIYLGFLAMRARSIWVSVGAHFYNNVYACVAIYLNMDDSIAGRNPEQMSMGSLLLAFWFFGVVFLVSTLYFMRVTAPADMLPSDQTQ